MGGCINQKGVAMLLHFKEVVGLEHFCFLHISPVLPEPVVNTGDMKEVDTRQPSHSVAKLEVLQWIS